MNKEEKKKRKEKIKQRRKIRKIKRELPEQKLHLLWHKKAKDFNPKHLIYIVGNINYLPLQKRALRCFLSIKNLTFDNFDRMLNAAKNVFSNNVYLKKQFYKQCFIICTENNLVELGEEGDAEAIKELILRIKTGSAKNSSGLRALIRFFEKTTSPKARMELWKIIKEFDPCERDLIELHNIVYGKHGFHEIVEDIQKHLKKKPKKEEATRKTILRIEELVEQIKKGQE